MPLVSYLFPYYRLSATPKDFMNSLMSDSGRLRRSTRACLQCRARKQRCHGESDISTAPCQRCRTAGKPCSFETDQNPRQRHQPYISSSKLVEDLQAELSEHKTRLEALESALGLSHLPRISGSDASSSPGPSPIDVPKINRKLFSMTGVSLGAPIATIRSLGNSISDEDEGFSESISLGRSNSIASQPYLSFSHSSTSSSESSFDLVGNGILSLQEAQRLFDIFFLNCHNLIPVLCIRTQRDADRVRHSSPLLFTAICSIGARYWNLEEDISDNIPNEHIDWLHPRYAEIVEVLDQSILYQLLRPTVSSVKLESVQAILLYIQWMPLESAPPYGSSHSSQSRFNDVSAWALIGVAIRQAAYIGLDRAVQAPFHSIEDITDNDMRCMRVWIMLLSIDHHLTLTARLPATLDPAPAARVARAFGSHPRAESSDLRIAGNCELVAIIHRAAMKCGDASLVALDQRSLQEANAELDEWESVWRAVLSNSSLENVNNQIPFTSLRWYRLAINVVTLSSSFSSFGADSHLQNATPTSLTSGVEAATAMLCSFSGNPIEALSPAPIPLTINSAALATFRYSIDTHWITHAFAVVFLALSYDRGFIDDELNILNNYQMLQGCQMAPGLPRDRSPLFRLVQLARNVFQCGATHAPATFYRDIVLNTFEALTQCPQTGSVGDAQGVFATIMDEGFEWSLDRTATFGLTAPSADSLL